MDVIKIYLFKQLKMTYQSRRKFPLFLALFFLIILILFSFAFKDFVYSTLEEHLKTPPPPEPPEPPLYRLTYPPVPPVPSPPSPKGQIVVQCAGRLGNAMFEWASALGIARSLNASPCFLCSPQEETLEYLQEMGKMFTEMPALCPEHFRARFPYQKEKGFATYDPTLMEKFDSNTGRQIGEYLQSYRYFADISPFTFKPKIPLNITRALFDMGSVVVGVHVRRGDKVASDAERHIVPDAGYFGKAMELCRQKYGETTRFLVVSDEIEWCQKQTVFHAPDVRIAKANNTPAEDFMLLAHSDHVIISMGTFAWWAGYLSGGDVYYHVEFNLEHALHKNFVQLKDYYPSAWINVL